MKNRLILLALTTLTPVLVFAQEQQDRFANGYDPHYDKIFPDKIIEIGLPLLFLYSLGNLLVTILKQRAENQLKLRMVDKGVSEETLITLFKGNQVVNKLQPLKWGLFGFALGFAFLAIHILDDYLRSKSGFLALAILLICVSIAFFIYYRILSRHTFFEEKRNSE